MREKSPQDDIALSTSRPKSDDYSSLKFLASFLPPYQDQMRIALISLVVASLMVLSIGWGLRYLVDHGLSSHSSVNLTLALTSLFVAVAVMAVASYGRAYYVTWLGERITTDLRQKLFSHILDLDVSYFEDLRGGEVVSRLTTDTSLIQVVMGTSAAVALRNILLIAGGLFMMLITSWELTLYTLIIVPLIIIPIIIFGKWVKKLSKETQDKIANVGGFLEEVVNSIRTTQSFNHQDIDRKKFESASEDAFTSAINRTKAKSILSSVVMTLVFAGICIVFWVGGNQVLNQEITAGELSAFIFFSITVAGSLGSFAEIIADLQRAAGACERLQELLGEQSRFPKLDAPKQLPENPQGILALHNLSFSYPSHPDHQILKNITVSITPGEKVAIVGPSGAGKSTIFSLLLRFYKPTAGKLYFDGIDADQLDLENCRSLIGVVPQDPMIFSTTLYENILYGHPHATPAEIDDVVRQAHLEEVVNTLPHGLKTQVGVRGVRLSGGQKQRVAIARAILRNPAILLLDEATNALDAESEHHIQNSLQTLMHGRTTLIIAHRLATVKNADKIIVLDQGKVLESGKHDALLTSCPLYKRLSDLQFQI